MWLNSKLHPSQFFRVSLQDYISPSKVPVVLVPEVGRTLKTYGASERILARRLLAFPWLG
jgi:hypothetical protein